MFVKSPKIYVVFRRVKQKSTKIYKGGGGVQKVQKSIYVEYGCRLMPACFLAFFFPTNATFKYSKSCNTYISLIMTHILHVFKLSGEI